MTGLVDRYQRKVTYLRLSVTDRCDFRCVYCMTEQMTFAPNEDLLALDEMVVIAREFVNLGVRHLRLTGGEPLVRKGVLNFVSQLGSWINQQDDSQRSDDLDTGCGLQELTMTTNGSQLYRYAQELYNAGVRRVNISMDSLDSDQFKKITRRGDLAQVMKGLKVADSVGLKIKINTVALKGVNETEIHDLVRFCGERGYDLSLIEVMPMGDIGNERRLGHYWSLRDVKKTLDQKWTLTSSSHSTSGPARYFDCKETGGRIGFITPLSHRFCESCNRVRLSSTGRLYLCLGQEEGTDLRQLVRGGASSQEIRDAIRGAIWHKPLGHDFVIDRSKGDRLSGPQRLMSVTGG